jgi:phenylalanyl-tRNA synthetase alpha chain
MDESTIETIKNQLQMDIESGDKKEDIKNRYLSRQNGIITALIKQIPSLSPEEKQVLAPEIMNLKRLAEDTLGSGKSSISEIEVDKYAPAINAVAGNLNPLSLIKAEIEDIMIRMGFSIKEGPEVDSVENNFDLLNVPKDHPSRDSQDTFFTDYGHVLRTHTSNMQARHFKENEPPFKVAVIGRTFRNEALDATHEHTFHQLEAFAVDKNIGVPNLKWTLETLFSELFNKRVKVRFRPSFFPFVEPGFETDAECQFCEGQGCRICKHTGWVEWGGSGMIHPKVLSSCGLDAETYRGFAFGFGIDRIAMMKFKINDIRSFFRRDLRFIKQKF